MRHIRTGGESTNRPDEEVGGRFHPAQTSQEPRVAPRPEMPRIAKQISGHLSKLQPRGRDRAPLQRAAKCNWMDAPENSPVLLPDSREKEPTYRNGMCPLRPAWFTSRRQQRSAAGVISRPATTKNCKPADPARSCLKRLRPSSKRAATRGAASSTTRKIWVPGINSINRVPSIPQSFACSTVPSGSKIRLLPWPRNCASPSQPPANVFIGMTTV